MALKALFSPVLTLKVNTADILHTRRCHVLHAPTPSLNHTVHFVSMYKCLMDEAT